MLTAQVYRAASLPDAATRVARALTFFALPFTDHDIHTLLEAARRVRDVDPASMKTDDDELARLAAWNDESAAVFSAAGVAAGAAQAIADPVFAPSAPPELAPPASASLGPTQASSSSFEPSWLRLRCGQLAAVSAGDGLSAAEMAASVLSLLTDESRTNEHLQSDLFDAFMGDFDAVSEVLSCRAEIAANADAIVADCAHASDFGPALAARDASRSARGVKGRRRDQGQRAAVSAQIIVRDVRQEALEKEERRTQRRLVRSGLLVEDQIGDEEDLPLLPALGGSAYEERQRFFPGVQVEGDSVIGSVDRVGLPRGSTREVGKGYEEIFVPPPSRSGAGSERLVLIADALAEHPELLQAMRGVTTLNRLQSSVYPAAFQSDENLLVCAPTGAGKTNVALLTIFREIVGIKQRFKRSFKVVYVAPMKALAAEVTEKFGKRLGPLGLRVREFTGDMSLSRVEALETHVLVTTPEKWDVVTRKTGSELGDAVTLFIVDEIHLLHDDRGAVLESIVARTLRLSETAQRQVRLVGLSATLPNYADVGAFMRVNPKKGLFHFDGSHRPVPLSQTFIGISEGGRSNSYEARRRREAKVHEMAWKKVKDSLQRGHQAMIFVHSRKGTAMAAREMLSRAAEDLVEDIFLGGESSKGGAVRQPGKSSGKDGTETSSAVLPTWAAKEIAKSKSSDIRDLCARGVGIHNAGLPRPDRKLVEKLFAEGVIRLLCCTATLAWGVNLPARTVIIMGTEVYNAEKGGFVQLGMLDVMQIFGRAGRPQFDTEGEGTIITMHEHLGTYLSLLTSSIPIESKLGASASRLADHLNAEIVSGTVSSIGEGVRWLSYTYLSVRMPQNPLVYGIDWSEVEADSGLHSRRATLIEQASKALDDARMCRYDPRTGALAPTDLGRVSSHFYVSHETVVLWNELLANLSMEPAVTDADWEDVYCTVLHAVSCATEFEQMRSRQEEAEELDSLTRQACPIPLKSGSETREGKVAILLQAYISRAPIRMSDLSYVVQSCTRLLRALFEVSLRRGFPSLSLASLELARASESRIWPFQHPLWQFTYSSKRVSGLMINPETVATIEASGDNGTLGALREMTKDELSLLVRAPKMSLTVQKVLRAVPTLDIKSASVAPLNRTVLLVEVRLFPNFRWNDAIHGKAESWWLWVEDHEEDRIYHSQRILLTKGQVRSMNADRVDDSSSRRKQTLNFRFSVPVFDPPSSQYWVRVESETWHTGGGSTAVLSVSGMDLPEEEEEHVDLLDLRPLPVRSSLDANDASLFLEEMSHFKPLQTQAFHTARHTDENILVAAPSGSGKRVVAEIAILRALHEHPNATVVYIAPDRDTLLLRQKNWQKLKAIVDGNVQVIDSRCTVAGQPPLDGIRVLLATSNAWNHFSKSWTDELIAEWVCLFVFDELHLLSSVKHVGLEVTISRLRHLSRKQKLKEKRFPRLTALCEAVPNAAEFADWLGVERKKGFYCFNENVRQVPRESQVIGVAGDRYTSRMHSVNRTLFSMILRYSAKKPVLIYVSSRRQALLTAQDLTRLASIDGKEKVFLNSEDGSDPVVQKAWRDVSDSGLRRSLSNGIGLYHESMTSRELDAVELLYTGGHAQVMIATFEMARRFTVPSHLVVVKGTEIYQPMQRRYEDIPVADVLHMIGQAGRPAVDSVCYAIVFVHEPKKTLFKKFLHESLPIESALHENIPKVLLREISSWRVNSLKEAVEFFTWTFMFQRLKTNPGYYGIQKATGSKSARTKNERRSQAAIQWSTEKVTEALQTLSEANCILISKGEKIESSLLGYVSSSHGLSFEIVGSIHNQLPECSTFEEIIRMLGSVDEISDLVIGFEEEAVWTRLCEVITDKFCEANRFENRAVATKSLGLTRSFESQEKRTLAACYSLLIDGMTRLREFGVDRVQLGKAFEQVLAAAFDIVSETGKLSQVLEFIKVSQCIYQGTLPTEDFWALSGYATERICGRARKSGYSTLASVHKDEAAFSGFVAQNSANEAQRSAILRWLGRQPRLTVRARKEGGAEKAVVVDLEVKRNSSRGRDGADSLSRVSRKRGGGFVVVVGNKGKDTVYGVRRVADGGKEKEKVSVVVGLKGEYQEGEEVSVVVISDVSIGVQEEAVVA